MPNEEEVEESPEFLAELDGRTAAVGGRTYTIEEVRAEIARWVERASGSSDPDYPSQSTKSSSDPDYP